MAENEARGKPTELTDAELEQASGGVGRPNAKKCDNCGMLYNKDDFTSCPNCINGRPKYL